MLHDESCCGNGSDLVAVISEICRDTRECSALFLLCWLAEEYATCGQSVRGFLYLAALEKHTGRDDGDVIHPGSLQSFRWSGETVG